MTPIEHYWPPEMLAQAFPEKYGHLVAKAQTVQGSAEGEASNVVGASGYTVEPISGGCHVIRPRFGAGIRFRERKG